jgi:hypothetical protein
LINAHQLILCLLEIKIALKRPLVTGPPPANRLALPQAAPGALAAIIIFAVTPPGGGKNKGLTPSCC